MMQDLLAGFQMRVEILQPCDPESSSKGRRVKTAASDEVGWAIRGVK